MLNNSNIWEEIKSKLKYDSSITADVYNTYISKTFLYKKIDNNLVIHVNNKMSVHIINSINDLILKILNKDLKLNYNIEYKYFTKEEDKKEKKNKEKLPIKTNENNANNYLFDNFVIGNSNNQAYIAAKQVAESPGNLWNPLFIFGDSGLGKTHLLLSIKNKVERIYDNYKVSYISSEKFGTMSIDIMSKGYLEIEKFKNNFKDLDVLLIDDIQLLAKRTKTNELFFYIFNHFIENNKQIVISSDKMPDELKNGFEKRLITRFNSGLSIQISKPDYITALEILKMKLKIKNNYKLFSDEAVKYIAKYFSEDVRKLEGTMNRMIFYTIIQKKDHSELIEVKDIEEAFKNEDFKFNEKNEEITIKKIQKFICNEYNITSKILLGRSRISNIAKARQVAMYFSRKLTKSKLTDISQEFNRKDHTTVINAIKKTEKNIKDDKEFKKFVNKLSKKIKNNTI